MKDNPRVFGLSNWMNNGVTVQDGGNMGDWRVHSFSGVGISTLF